MLNIAPMSAGQQSQEGLLSTEPRHRRASASACVNYTDRIRLVGNPTSAGHQDPQRRARPVSVPSLAPGSNTDAYARVSSRTAEPRNPAYRLSNAASFRLSLSNPKTGTSASNCRTKEVNDGHNGRLSTRGATGKTEQTKDFPFKQQSMQSDAGTFIAVVLAQRWLGKLRLDPFPITRELQEASETSYRQQIFVPDSRIRDIVQDKVVQDELYKSNKSIGKPSRMLKAPVVSKDYASFRKILAILFLMKRPPKIRLFVKSGLRDDHLPLRKIQHANGFGSSATLTSRNTPGSPSMMFKRLEDADEFLERQWSVLAPVFVGSDETVPHKDLESESILPFLSETIIAKEGGSSKVFKARIHRDHHHLGQTDCSSDIYAIKVLKSEDEEDFKREVTVLRKLRTRNHTHVHLITLLATYRHGATYHLIFPWAEADLLDYWKRLEDAPPEDDHMGTWVIEQCRGLADGLYSIHRYETFSGTSILNAFKLSSRVERQERNEATHTKGLNVDQITKKFFGRHGDLKPQNILWYPDPSTTGGHGVLKITDFGVTRFNTENMWDTKKTGRLPNSPTYRSPENDLHGKLTTACDVWALGCVYLEFVTWYFGGNRLVQRFGERRLAPDLRMANMRTDTFFTIQEEMGVKKANVKPEVLTVIEDLREHRRCTEDYNKILDMIKDDMLVVHQQEALDSEDGSPILRKSVSEPTGVPRLGYIRRKSCGDVFRRLGDIKPCSDQEEPSSPVIPSHPRKWP